MKCRGQRDGSRRGGVVVLWVILAMPVLLVGLCAVIDFANIWTARHELEAALEAAALAGVDTWADESRADAHDDPDGPIVGGTALKTDVAREAARAAAASNFVRGIAVDLDLNDNGSLAHDNNSCDGDIVLGGYDDTLFTFEQAADVGCGRTQVTIIEVFLTIRINIDTTATSDTSNASDAFRITLENTGGGNPNFTGSVTQIVFNLRNPDFANGPPGPSFAEAGVANPPGVDGVFDPYGGVGVPGEANGFGPLVDAGTNEVAGVTFDTSDAANGLLVINIPPGNFTTAPGQNELVFGIDTDGVGDGTPAASPTDRGGDFGDPGAAAGTPGRTAFQLGINGIPAASSAEIESLQPNGPDRARLQGNAFNLQGNIQFVIVIDNEDFAVLAQKTMSVPSLWSELFGAPVGPYQVSARAVAASKCRNLNQTDPEVLNPQLVHVPVGNVICP